MRVGQIFRCLCGRVAVASAMIVAVVILQGCHTRRGATMPIVPVQRQWTAMSVPVKVELTEPSEVSLSGRMIMVRDSLIDLSIRFLGMEAAWITATQDSLRGAVRHNKLGVSAPIDALWSDPYTSIAEIQGLILGDNPRASNAGSSTTIIYADSVTTPCGLLPQTMILTKEMPAGRRLRAILRLNYDKLVRDDDVAVPRRTIPSSYRMIPFDKIVENVL